MSTTTTKTSHPALFSAADELVADWGLPAVLRALAEVVTDRTFRDPSDRPVVARDKNLAGQLRQTADKFGDTGYY